MLFYVAGFYLSLPLLLAASLRWGGKPERSVAIMYVFAATATVAARHPWSVRYVHLESGVLAVDLLLIFGLLWVSIRWQCWWAMIAAAFQIVASLAHLSKIVDPAFLTNGYALMVGLSSWPSLLLLAIGIATSRRGTRRNAKNI